MRNQFLSRQSSRLHFHFIGIGGTGMSALAEILKSLGCSVSGSDSSSKAEARLSSCGIRFFQGHKEEHIGPATDYVIFSSAISADNPEILGAKKLGKKLLHRGELLAEVMRMHTSIAVAGSHGKTSTTAILSSILVADKRDPSIAVGTVLDRYDSGGVLGTGPLMVAEADESDRSFLQLNPDALIVTNIDNEHLANYASIEELEYCFYQLMERVPFYGVCLVCVDDPRTHALSKELTRRCLSYGLQRPADYSAISIESVMGGSRFSITYHEKVVVSDLFLPLPGKHMVSNAVAASAVALELGVSPQSIAEGLAQSGGIKRRSEILLDGPVRMFTDYAHHPAEIEATLLAFRQSWVQEGGRLISVFQPHRYTRQQESQEFLSDVFDTADVVCVTDIYAAGEAPIPGCSVESVLGCIRHKKKRITRTFNDVSAYLRSEMREGDVIVFMGAGDIDAFARSFAQVSNKSERALRD